MGVGRFFPGGPLVDFSKMFPGGAKSGEICFFPLKTIKTTLFWWKFQSPEEGQTDAHDWDYQAKHCKTTFLALPRLAYSSGQNNIITLEIATNPLLLQNCN